jgi:hypothetical protein
VGDANCCCDSSAVLPLTTTIVDNSYGPQGGATGFRGYAGSNYSAHSVTFVPPAVTSSPTNGSSNFTRTLTYKVCLIANNREDPPPCAVCCLRTSRLGACQVGVRILSCSACSCFRSSNFAVLCQQLMWFASNFSFSAINQRDRESEMCSARDAFTLPCHLVLWQLRCTVLLLLGGANAVLGGACCAVVLLCVMLIRFVMYRMQSVLVDM